MPIRRALLAGAILSLCATGAAHGATYCVAPKTGCADGDHPTIASALASASASVGLDRVELGEATYTATPVVLSDVDLVGAGVGKTRFDGPGITTDNDRPAVIDVAANASVRDLSVEIPAGWHPSTRTAGLHVRGLAEDVRVTADSLAQVAIGFYVGLNGTARRVTTAIQTTNQHFVGAQGQNGSVVEDSSLRGYYAAIGVDHIRRSLLTGVQGFSGTRAQIENSVIALDSSNTPQEAIRIEAGSLSLHNVTVVGDGDGAGIQMVKGVGDKTTALVRSSVVRGFNWPFRRASTDAGGGTGFDVDYSSFDKDLGVIATGPGEDTLGTHNLDDVDPRFVSASVTHPFAFRLAHDSPLRNAGDPAAVADVREGRRDIGAHEFQAQPPVAALAAPATAEIGQSVTVDTTGTADPDGEAVTLSIDFGDGSAAGTATQHAYAAAGTYPVTLTVSDAEGKTATGVASITVTGPAGGNPAPGGSPAPGGGTPVPPAGVPSVTPPSPDTTPPALSLVSAKVVKRRLRLSVLLGESAAVKLTVVRSRACRRVKGRRRCAKAKVVSTRTLAAAAGPVTIKVAKRLARGAHVVTLVAADAAGNAGIAVTKKLTVR